MRIPLLILASLLAACSGKDTSQLRAGPPGLSVARAALESGAPDVAARVAEGVLTRNPHDVDALVSHGDATAALGRTDDALASYTKALAIDPNSTGAKMGLGRLRLTSDPAQAQLLFLSVLEKEPRNAAALNNLGIARDLQGDHASAQDAYRKALGADPSMRGPEVNLALSMALNGQAANAVPLLAPLARNVDASPRLRHSLAAVLMMAGDKDAARRILSQDLTPEQVERALLGYEALGTGALAPVGP
jgi:Flp pilus assembly protein TadD